MSGRNRSTQNRIGHPTDRTTSIYINEIVGKVHNFIEGIRTMQTNNEPLKVSLETLRSLYVKNTTNTNCAKTSLYLNQSRRIAKSQLKSLPPLNFTYRRLRQPRS
jgi:hypothetical protein